MIIHNQIDDQIIQKHYSIFCRYKNALYQGVHPSSSASEPAHALIFLHADKHFIASSKFCSNNINGNSLFLHQSRKYMYGFWRQNFPSGISLIRLQDILIIAQFEHGILSEGSKVLVILQKWNIGTILQMNYLDELKPIEKSQVYCQQHINSLLKKCGFKQQTIHFCLVKFINECLTKDPYQLIKLRVIQDRYYKYGFVDGLALIFDDSQEIVSVGYHIENKLESFQGQQQRRNQHKKELEPGVIKKNCKSSPNKIGKIYKSRQVENQSLSHKYFIDPSTQYFEYFEKHLDQKLIKQIRCGFFVSKNPQKPLFTQKKKNPLQTETIPETVKTKNNIYRERKSILRTNSQQQAHYPLPFYDNDIKLYQVRHSADRNQSNEQQCIRQKQKNGPDKYLLKIIKKQQKQLLNHRDMKYQFENNKDLLRSAKNEQPRQRKIQYQLEDNYIIQTQQQQSQQKSKEDLKLQITTSKYVPKVQSENTKYQERNLIKQEKVNVKQVSFEQPIQITVYEPKRMKSRHKIFTKIKQVNDELPKPNLFQIEQPTIDQKQKQAPQIQTNSAHFTPSKDKRDNRKYCSPFARQYSAYINQPIDTSKKTNFRYQLSAGNNSISSFMREEEYIGISKINKSPSKKQINNSPHLNNKTKIYLGEGQRQHSTAFIGVTINHQDKSKLSQFNYQ